jgi:serine/threonine protein kinase
MVPTTLSPSRRMPLRRFPMETTSDRDVAALRIGRYRMVREVGCGAMGVVYEAEHIELGRRVALKLLQPALRGNATAKARFAREGRVAAKLHHSHAIEVLDAGLSEEGPFLVMEYVDGPTFATYLRELGAISTEHVVELVLPILSALAHAHALGVVHRDVKPANVLLARDRLGDLFPKIGDFGLGKSKDESGDWSLTKDGVVGSLPYMAPEQVREAKAVDGRADQYALAVLIYEAVAGRLPFEGTSGFALMEAICAGNALPLMSVAPGVPPAFAEVVHRAMKLRVEDRYSSLADFGRDLVRFSAGRLWSAWAREFPDPTTAPLGQTIDDAKSSVTDVGAALGPRPASKRTLRGLVSPAVYVALGAFCATAVFYLLQPKAPPSTRADGEAPIATFAASPIASLAPPDDTEERPPAASSANATVASVRRIDSPPRSAPALRTRSVLKSPAASSSAATGRAQEFGRNNAPILE